MSQFSHYNTGIFTISILVRSSLQVSHFFIYLVRHWLPLVPDYPLKGVCIASSLEDRNGVSLQSKGQACLLPIIKDSGLLCFEFLSYSTAHKYAGIPMELQGQCNSTNMLLSMLLVKSWVIKSFVSDPGFSCLLPVSKAFKWSKISDPSQFLTPCRI